MRSVRTATVLGMVVAGTVTLLSSPRQSDDRTIHNGVYADRQASRGRPHYEQNCQSCHGADLAGGTGRALAGDGFLEFWAGLTLDALFERVQSMPPGAASSLGGDVYVDILAFLLYQNGLPPGPQPLAAEDLSHIRIEGEDGPQPAADFSLVQVVGCLGRGADETWVVSRASEPLRTRGPDLSTGDALTVARAIGLGTGSFELLYVHPDPAPFHGHRVEAKGFLIRDPVDRINVTSFQSLASSCEE